MLTQNNNLKKKLFFKTSSIWFGDKLNDFYSSHFTTAATIIVLKSLI